MKFLKIILYILLTGFILVLGLGLFARHIYPIERSIEIDAPRAVVLDQIRYFSNFRKWSPWNTLDPNMKETLEGTDGTVGAVSRWEGNDDVGAGSQTIKSISQDRVQMEVVLQKPWKGTSPSVFILEEIGEKTKVTWKFDMYVGFPWNSMAMMTDVNAQVGKDYARGLGTLKKVCEQIVHPKYRGYEIAESDLPAQYYAGLRDTIKHSEIAAFFAANFPLIAAAVKKSGIEMTGVPSSLTYVWDDSTKTADIVAAIPIAKSGKIDTFALFNIGGHRALTIDYFGIYDSIGPAHMAMGDYMKEKGLQLIPPAIEEYVTDPAAEPDTLKWLTKVIYFVEPKPDSLKMKK